MYPAPLFQILKKVDIITNRTTIRPPILKDWEAFNTLETDPVYYRFMPPGPIGAEEERRERFELNCCRPKNGDSQMIFHNEDLRVIGWCWLAASSDAPKSRGVSTYEIALTIHHDYWHKGYGTEVFEALLGLAKKYSKIGQLWEQVHIDNEASLKIVRRHGFCEIPNDKPDFRGFILDVSGSIS